jgi:hypothetical protein
MGRTISVGCTVKHKSTERLGVIDSKVEEESQGRTKVWMVKFIDASGKQSIEKWRSQQLTFVSAKGEDPSQQQGQPEKSTSKSRGSSKSEIWFKEQIAVAAATVAKGMQKPVTIYM